MSQPGNNNQAGAGLSGATLLNDMEVAKIPRRRRVLGWSLIRGEVTLLVAPPGVGKSTLGLAQAIAICTGKKITYEEVHESGKVWVYNNEDSRDELMRRVAAILQHNGIPFSNIKGRLAVDSGADRPLLMAKADRQGGVIRLPDVDACIEIIKRGQFSVFIADPFAETHEVQENSNEQIKRVGQMFREIAWRGDCAVLLIHHTAKPPQGSAEGHAGNMNTARGASALAGIARVVQTIFSMSVKDAHQHGIPEAEKHLFVRLDDAKANLSLVTGKALWFKRVGVVIENGDEVGILQPVDLALMRPQALADDDAGHAIIAALLAAAPGRQISLNAAAKLLAWGQDEQFHRYRETDSRKQQRATRKFREMVAAAARAGLEISTAAGMEGFQLLEDQYPQQLRRFTLRIEATSNPSEREADDE